VPRRTDDVVSVTTAQRGLSDDLAQRTRRYLWTMGVRTLCFILAIIVEGPLRWVLVVLAVVLPYFGVVGANAGRERSRDAVLEPVESTLPALEPAPSVPWTPESGPSAAPPRHAAVP
jgi:hypothetical protein